MNSVVFTQEYLQLILLPVHFKLQFFSVLERGSQTLSSYYPKPQKYFSTSFV
jgi:hypothetical protein